MNEDKIRISIVSTFRVTDCNRDLIKAIDAECSKQHVSSRVELIRKLSGNPLECREDVKSLQKWVKAQGFKTIEKWLDHEIRSKHEDNSNGF